MNSVLQGLIATRLLSDLVHFAPISPSIQERATTVISARRSPQLTNGHNLAGPHEQTWVNCMPIGDQFLSVLYKGWEFQAARRKDLLSPKAVLNALGRKYDQYLDFAQQDAHEFLRILLDAMRMEEQDIIKQRQPPPPPQKKRRRSTLVQPSASSSPNPPNLAPREMPEDEKLMSFVDMIFGGRLTSILVCQKCKHVSQTYEDFNDISLSIKPEDYKKKNRLKNLAKRLTNFPAPALPKFVAAEIQRSSSVPPSPKERPDGQLIGKEESPPSTSRRRSLELQPTESQSDQQAPETQKLDATPDQASVAPIVSVTGPVEEKGAAVEPLKNNVEEKEQEKDDKKKDSEDSNWARLGRRLSLTVGLSKPKEKKSKSQNRISAPILEGVPLDISKDTTGGKPSTTTNGTTNPTANSSNRGTSVDGQSVLSPQPKVATPARLSLDSRLSPSAEPILTHLPTPLKDHDPKVLRSKSPKPPKPSAGEVEYLRKILADVDTGSSSNPFSIFKPQQHLGASSSVTHQNAWLGLKTLSGIEECLRMFTAVEILDGENMVGCRRCWKIANGIIPNTSAMDDKMDDDDSDGGEQEPASPPADKNAPGGTSATSPQRISLVIPDESHTVSVVAPTPVRPGPHPAVHLPTSVSTPTVSFYASALDDHEHTNADTRSISSLPIQTEERTPSPTHTGSSTTLDRTPGGLPIPLISTTAPEPDSPPSSSASVTDVSASDDSDGAEEPRSPLPNGVVTNKSLQSVTGSLPVPPRRFGGRKAGDATTDDESSGDDSDTSVGTSVSADSSASHPTVSPGLPNGTRSQSQPNTPLTPKPSSLSPSQPLPAKRPSKPKPAIMRPAYKRYLIATPPPVLVIHLKRFQQISKTPFLSFSHGFKKLDDYVTFPEYLDLTPFLAPKKEDYGLGKKGKAASKDKRAAKEKERCMYRLYAVVVHIGNMLGGHYVAYTALPSRSPIEGEGLATKATEAPQPTAKAPAQAESIGSIQPPGLEPSPAPSKTPEPTTVPSPSPRLSRTNTSTSASTSSQDKPAERQWAYISDTVVRLTTLEEVLNTKAYICMYERC